MIAKLWQDFMNCLIHIRSFSKPGRDWIWIPLKCKCIYLKALQHPSSWGAWLQGRLSSIFPNLAHSAVKSKCHPTVRIGGRKEKNSISTHLDYFLNVHYLKHSVIFLPNICHFVRSFFWNHVKVKFCITQKFVSNFVLETYVFVFIFMNFIYV